MNHIQLHSKRLHEKFVTFYEFGLEVKQIYHNVSFFNIEQNLVWFVPYHHHIVFPVNSKDLRIQSVVVCKETTPLSFHK